MEVGRASALAIVGMSCRFPGAKGVDAYWGLLERGTDAVTVVPKNRFDIDAHYSATPGEPGRTVTRHGGFIDDLFSFDAEFFGIAPRDAVVMDPQQRVLLEVVWEALENAGIVPSSLAGSRTGVFVGQSTSDYAEVNGPGSVRDLRAVVGGKLRAVTAGRVSFALDLRGPSLVLDTACSSSLVAVHVARQSLLAGETDMAIAAGVNALLSPEDFIAYSEGEMLSPDGRCQFGDSSANGFVRSEGVGAVLLKRLPDAVRDGDPVLALLMGSAVTNDGQGSGLLLHPAVSGQVEMVRAACRSAGITPSRLDYVEAHGTGTSVGDAVEIRALSEALDSDGTEGAPPRPPLRVGSVKTNIGHAEAAAGIAGLIKAVLMARHRVIPASLHLRTPRSFLPAERPPVEVVGKRMALEPQGESAVLGVSSFGLSGTNAHVVVGEYHQDHRQSSAAPAPREERRPHLLVLSARSQSALRRLARRYADHLGPEGQGRTLSLDDICHTAAVRREAHPYRLWATGTTHDEIAAHLRAVAAGEETSGAGTGEAGFGEPRRIAFLFPGQGAQWAGMGQGLLAASAVFRSALSACDEAVRTELGWSVAEALEEPTHPAPTSVSRVQPAVWAMQVATATLLRDLGVTPDLCLGHSMGEAAAACVSGALSLADAAAVICRRSALMETRAGDGAMLAVGLSAGRARDIAADYAGTVCVAAENAPQSTVLSGDRRAIEEIAGRLERQGVHNRLVRVNVASHSPRMDALREELTTRLRHLVPSAPDIEMFSTTRCEPVRDAALDAAYWMDNLREPVRFLESVEAVTKRGETLFVEVSPNPVLTHAVEEIQEALGAPVLAVPTLTREHEEYPAITRAVGEIFASGGRVNWDRWFQGPRRHVPLPTYPWEREEFRQHSAPSPRLHGALTREISLRRLGVDAFGDGVTLRGATPVPPVLHVWAAAEVARDLTGRQDIVLEEISVGGGDMDLHQARDSTMHVSLLPTAAEGEFTFQASLGREARPMSGRLRTAPPDGSPSWSERVDTALTRCTEYVPGTEFHRRAQARGYGMDPALACVAQVWRRDGEAVARMRPVPGGGPACLEAGLLALLAAWPHAVPGSGVPTAYVPTGFGRVRLREGLDTGHGWWSLARFAPGGSGDDARADVAVVAADGSPLAEFRGIRLRQLPPEWSPLPDPAGVESEDGDRRSPADGTGSPDDVLAHMAAVLGMPVARLDVRRSLRDQGLDSLMAAQLRRRLRTRCGAEVTASRLLGRESAGSIVRSLSTAN